MAWSRWRWHDVGMHLLVTGIGDAFSNQFHGSSGLVKVEKGWIAIDCPGMVLAMWRKAAERARIQLPPDDVGDLVITHLHGDHCGGLETIGFLHRYMIPGDTSKPRLHAIEEVLDRLWERLAPAMDGHGAGLDDYFTVCPLQMGTPVEIAGCQVECRRTRHSVPTAGLLLSDEVGCLGWSADTEFDPDHVKWLERADCIVHECGEGGNHTTYEQLRSLPESIQSRLRLVHMPDSFQPPDNVLEPLREGEWIEVRARAGTAPVPDGSLD